MKISLVTCSSGGKKRIFLTKIRQTAGGKGRKKVLLPPLTACCTAEGWTCYHSDGLFAPHFSSGLAPLPPLCPPHPGIQSFSPLVLLSFPLSPSLLLGIWLNIQQLEGADVVRTMLPELQHFFVMVTPSSQPTAPQGNISATQRCLSFVGVINVQNPSKPQKHQVLNTIKPVKDAELVPMETQSWSIVVGHQPGHVTPQYILVIIVYKSTHNTCQ